MDKQIIVNLVNSLPYIVTLIIIAFIVNRSIEKFKNTLNKEAFRFSKLYEKQFEILGEIYGKIYNVKIHLQSYVDTVQVGNINHKERRKSVIEKMKEFQSYAFPNLIWLKEDTKKSIIEFNNKSKEIAGKFLMNVELYDRQTRDKSRTDIWEEIYEEYKIIIEPLLAKIEYEFRVIFGVSKKNKDTYYGARVQKR